MMAAAPRKKVTAKNINTQNILFKSRRETLFNMMAHLTIASFGRFQSDAAFIRTGLLPLQTCLTKPTRNVLGTAIMHPFHSKKYFEPNLRGSKVAPSRFDTFQLANIRLFSIHNGSRHACQNNFSRTYSLSNSLRKDDNEFDDQDPKELAEQVVSVLAQKGRTWKRLRHIVELACTVPTAKYDANQMGCIADIGCDHGLLSISLASTKKYKKVIGVDISSRALGDGALYFHEKAKNMMNGGSVDFEITNDKYQCDELSICKNIGLVPLEFRVGDGLEPLKHGEADAVCIAGMGIETMLNIISRKHTQSGEKTTDIFYLDELGCKFLYLQPTNSRPKNLVRLYKYLQEYGWTLEEERILYLSSRWYITCAFEKAHGEEAAENVSDMNGKKNKFLLPGTFLKSNSTSQYSSSERKTYERYVDHHVSWLASDLRKKGSLGEEDMQWLEQNKPIQ